jgi:hypothetical protein
VLEFDLVALRVDRLGTDAIAIPATCTAAPSGGRQPD